MNDGKTDKAVLALIFGIASLALCYVSIVGLIAGILAMVISGLYFKSGEKESTTCDGRKSLWCYRIDFIPCCVSGWCC